MSNELVINSTQNGCRIALLNDRRLIEFHQEDGGNQFNVGDIYLGTVRKVVQGSMQVSLISVMKRTPFYIIST